MSKTFILFRNEYPNEYNAEYMIAEVYQPSKRWKDMKKAIKSLIVRASPVTENTYNPVITINKKDIVARGNSVEYLKNEYSMYFI